MRSCTFAAEVSLLENGGTTPPNAKCNVRSRSRKGFQVLEEEIATEKTDGIVKMMRGIHLSTQHNVDLEMNLREKE